MADSGAAQNKLGELFVDIGVGGLGKSLKALNSVSASFLMTKNAAQQAIKPIVDVGKRTLGMAVDVGKLGSTLGIAYKDAYKLQYYFKHMNLNEGLLNDIERLSEQFNAMQRFGTNALTGDQQRGFMALGLNPMDYYGGGFEKIQQLIKDVQRRTANMDRVTAANAIQDIGLNKEWLYAFDRGVFDLTDALALSNEEIESAIAAQEELNKAMLTLENALQGLVVKITPYVTEYAPKIADAITKFAPKIADGMEEYLPPILETLGSILKALGWVLKIWNKIWEGIGKWFGEGLGGMSMPNYAPDAVGNALKIGNQKWWDQFNQDFHPEANKNIIPTPLAQPSVPNNIANTNNTVNITNNITGQNAAEIAQRTTNNTQYILKNMLYNPYQVHNNPGK